MGRKNGIAMLAARHDMPQPYAAAQAFRSQP